MEGAERQVLDDGYYDYIAIRGLQNINHTESGCQRSIKTHTLKGGATQTKPACAG